MFLRYVFWRLHSYTQEKREYDAIIRVSISMICMDYGCVNTQFLLPTNAYFLLSLNDAYTFVEKF